MGELRASVTTDGDGWFRAVSPAFLELIDRPVASLAGVGLVDLVHPLDAPAMRQLLAHVPRSGSPVVFSARVLAAGDRWQRCAVQARPASDGRITVEFVGESEGDSGGDGEPLGASPAAEVVPVWGVTSAPSFAELLTAAASVAGDEVPDQRVAVRERFGAETPLIEIDTEGRTVFAAGPWSEVSDDGRFGASALEELLDRTGVAGAVLDQVDAAMTTGTARQVRANDRDRERWIQILPIPSPHRSNQLHALLAVTGTRADGELLTTDGLTAEPTPRSEVPADEAATTGVAPAEAATPEAATPEATAGEAIAAEVADGVVSDGEDADADVAPAADTPETAAEEKHTAARRGGGFFGWLMIALAVTVAIVVLSKLWPSGDGSANTGPLDVAISLVEPVEIASGQSWRSLGVALAGEAHGIAATTEGAAIAAQDGTIVRLDSDAAALRAVTLGGDETTVISDIDVDDSGRLWALDAGGGRLFLIMTDDSVRQVATDPLPLNNARGIGVSADGQAWIASTASAQLLKIAADGAVTNSVALPGRQASDVVEAPDGTLWIVDAEELELVHLSLAGETLHTVRPEGFGFTSPQSPHMAIVEDLLWVTDPEASEVFSIDLATGELTGERVQLSRPGDEAVTKVIGIASDSLGRLWTVDSTAVATTILEP